MTKPTNTAEVRAHDRVMRYERSGTGQPLLVLGADQPGDVWPELTGLLAGHFRVLVPDIPRGESDAEWLNCFFDGLGVTEVSILAGGRYADVALELALGDQELVGRVVLVTTAGEAPRVAGSGHRPRIHVLPREIPVEEAAERIRAFLG